MSASALPRIQEIDEDRLMTATEVARLCRMSPRWVYLQVERDAIPHVRLGTRVRFRRSKVLEWIDGLERGE